MSVEISQTEKQRKKQVKNNYKRLQQVYHTHNKNARRRIEKGMKEIFQVIIMNSPKSMTDSKAQIQETQRIPSRKISKNTPKNILFKLQKNKKKLLKARGEWSAIIQVLKKKKHPCGRDKNPGSP